MRQSQAYGNTQSHRGRVCLRTRLDEHSGGASTTKVKNFAPLSNHLPVTGHNQLMASVLPVSGHSVVLRRGVQPRYRTFHAHALLWKTSLKADAQ